MTATCPQCSNPLNGGTCELCACRRQRTKAEAERDAWASNAATIREKWERQRDYIIRLHKQLEQAGLEPVASEEVA